MGERLAEAETGVVGGGISDDGASFGRHREKSKPKSDRRCAGVLGSPIRRPSTLAKHIRAAALVSSRRQARDVEGRNQIEVDDAAELVQGMWTLLAQGAQSDSTSRRVADEVQGAELVAGRRKGKLSALEVSDVAGVEAAPELLRDLRPLGPRKVEDRHLRTLPNQHLGRGLAMPEAPPTTTAAFPVIPMAFLSSQSPDGRLLGRLRRVHSRWERHVPAGPGELGYKRRRKRSGRSFRPRMMKVLT